MRRFLLRNAAGEQVGEGVEWSDLCWLSYQLDGDEPRMVNLRQLRFDGSGAPDSIRGNRIDWLDPEPTMTEETKWFYLSFADGKRPTGTQFLGGCIVRASHMVEAVRAAHLLGINPGGEVMGHPVPADGMRRARAVGYPLEKLLTRAELEDLDSRMLALPA